MPSVVAAATGVPADSGMTVAVIGLGYIGLSTAAALADGGVTVLGVDIDPERVAAVASGTVTTDEADLTRL
ncbi:MAG TPA: 3-hydroxyacyl-CoA dehydrogenase NAD-binding domain-containing protein, partial [Bauldia sp.]|nr:3-hydroxyacyl-CoA dehydrogenase NAD-binding domain-containing protein [Bauldia sp.]